MKPFLIILVVATLPFLSSCHLFDNEPELPPITTEGKGTFGCLVNGKLFLPDAPFGYGTGVRAELYKDDTLSAVNIYAGNSTIKESFFISILDEPFLQTGYTYDLTDTTRCGIEYLTYMLIPSCDYVKVISGSVKLLKFEVTSTPKIIAGTFELTASSVDCKDTIIVTQGRFDISDVQ